MGVNPGDRVKRFIHPEGSVVLLPKLPASSLKGMLKARRRVTLESMNRASQDAAANATPRRSR
jgi:antitoxin PrlF